MAPPPELVAFCSREYPRLVGTLSLYCGDSLLAEELAQETLVRVCRDWKKVARMEHSIAWMHRVAINLANSYFRRKAAERRAQEKLSAGFSGEVTQPDSSTKVAVRQAMSSLPARQRTALILRYFRDLPYSEIAVVMSAPESTVRSLAQRGLARLRERIDVLEIEEAPNAV